MSQAIQLYSQIQSAADIERIGMAWGKTVIFGNDRQEYGIIALMTCAQEGITPIQFTSRYDIIGGKVRKNANAAHADFRERGGRVKWIKIGDDGKEAKADFTFEGQTITLSFTIEQAERQKLVRPGSNWEKTPMNMLQARLLSNAIRMLCPEIYAGIGDSDIEADVPAPQINLAPSPAIEAEVIPPTPPEPPKPKGVAPHTPADTTKAARADQMRRLGEALANDADMAAALAYLHSTKISKGPWLASDAGLDKLTDEQLLKIVNALPAFLKASHKFVVENP